jgi:hypothetical protein
MKNLAVELYEKEKAIQKKWLDENKELEEATIYAAVKLKVALLDVGIAMAQAFGEMVEKINKVKIHDGRTD